MLKTELLKTEDNINISINYYSNNLESVIIICPGWFQTKDGSAFSNMAKDFANCFDVIGMDFRGHGKSSGFFTFSAREYNDLRAVVNYAKNQYKKIFLLGFSLGAATSIIYTAKYKDIDGVIAVSPPSDFNKIENHFFRKEAFIPTVEKFEIGRALSVRPGNIFLKKTKPIDVVQNISSIPILFIAGDKDPTVYPWHTEKLYQKAQGGKSLVIFKDSYHAEDLYLYSKDKFMDVCTEWLNNC